MVRTAEKGVRTVEGKFDRTEKLMVGETHGMIFPHEYLSQHFTKSNTPTPIHTHKTEREKRREREKGRRKERRKGARRE